MFIAVFFVMSKIAIKDTLQTSVGIRRREDFDRSNYIVYILFGNENIQLPTAASKSYYK